MGGCSGSRRKRRRRRRGDAYHQPVHALIHAATIHSRACHDAPVAIPQLTEPEGLGDLARALGARLVLLVGKDKECGVFELLLVEHGREFVGGGLKTIDIGRVDDEYDGRRVSVVAPPVRADARLATQILRLPSLISKSRARKGGERERVGDRGSGPYPDVEVQILVGHGFDVEAYCGYRRDDLANLETVEESSLACIVLYADVFVQHRGTSAACVVGGEPKAPRARTRPRISILISFFAHSRLVTHDMDWPILSAGNCIPFFTGLIVDSGSVVTARPRYVSDHGTALALATGCFVYM